MLNRGSSWNKWDLHIHSPESALANEYRGSTINEKWDNYIDQLERIPDLHVLGITDYFSINGYKKIIQYKNKGRLGNIKLIIPNIELRILPVTDKVKAINLHLLINPEIIDNINSMLLNNLEFEYKENKYKCIDDDLIRLGKEYLNNQDADNNAAYVEGINQFKTTIGELKSIIKKNKKLKENIIIGVSNNRKDGNSGIKHSSLASTRQEIYRFAHLIFSGNPADAEYFLGQGVDDIEKIKNDYGSIKPCIHGSDAHSLENIFKPDLNRYTWIKAYPSFNGLKQIIFEPDQRVKIQENQPYEKSEYKTIKKVRFIDNSSKVFSKEWILLNKDLNSIIGGKSSGKSLLLYHICKAIDSTQIDKINSDSRYKSIEYDFSDIDSFSFEVMWDDNEVSILNSEDNPNRPITYIPQLFLNRLAEDRKDDLNSLVENMLKDTSDEYEEFRKKIDSELSVNNKEIVDIITELTDLEQERIDKSNELKLLGDEKAITKSVENLKDQIKELRSKSKFTEDEEKEYTTFNERIEKTKIDIRTESNRLEILENLKASFIEDENIIKKALSSIVEDYLGNSFNINYTDEIEEEISNIIDKVNSELNPILIEKLTTEFDIVEQIRTNSAILRRRKKRIEARIAPYLEKIGNRKKYDELTKKRKEESKVLEAINNKKKEISEIETKINYSELLELYSKKIELYKSIVKENEKYKVIPDSDHIEIVTSVHFNVDYFDQNFSSKINKKSSLRNQFGETFTENDEFEYTLDNQDKNISHILDVLNKSQVKYNSGFEKKDILLSLFRDYFHIDYDLIQNGDNLLKMSPGKRGIILFQIFLHLSKSTDPILIDQPEDNLDNRTVYYELNEFIRKKKLDRQIIIASHNPNLVVSTDSENVIIANQDGQNSSAKNKQFKFEYKNGPLENTYIDSTKKSILEMKGIKEHVCEILEGGVDAFEKREKKYGIQNNER